MTEIKEVGSEVAFTLDAKVFGVGFNEALVHQVLTGYLQRQRLSIKSQKTRAQVSGGGRKPWKQKGTGRARAGSTRGPLWRGGGRAFAAVPGGSVPKINKRMYRGAMKSVLSGLARDGRLLTVDQSVLAMDKPCTRQMSQKIKSWGLDAQRSDSLLLVGEDFHKDILLSLQNIPRVGVCASAEINPYLLLKYEHTVVTKDALNKMSCALSSGTS